MDPNAMPSMEEMQYRQQQQSEMEAQRIAILAQILEPSAKERLSRLSLVKKEFVRSVEDSLINAAKNGKLASKVTEDQLIQMLEQMAGSGSDAAPGAAVSGRRKVTIQRKKKGGFDDIDDDDDDSDML